MRLDVRVEEGKGRVPSEIGTEPDRVDQVAAARPGRSRLRNRVQTTSMSGSPRSSAATMAGNAASTWVNNTTRRVLPNRSHTTAGPSVNTRRIAKSSGQAVRW